MKLEWLQEVLTEIHTDLCSPLSKTESVPNTPTADDDNIAKALPKRRDFDEEIKPERMSKRQRMTSGNKLCIRQPVFELAWSDDAERDVVISTSPDKIARMERNCPLSKTAVKCLVQSYLQKKYKESSDALNPFTVHSSFYALFREIAGATHEMFADALNQSGEMDFYCSKELIDEKFGSQGPWQNVEEKVAGAVGHPPFNDSFLRKLLQSIANSLRTGRPYFRALLLPYRLDSELHTIITSISFVERS